MKQRILFAFLGMLLSSQVFAQIDPDSTQNIATQDTSLIIYNDTTVVLSDSAQHVLDSIAEREAFVRDSIIAREKFVADSLIARAKFVADSLYTRKLIKDSVTFLQKELPKLIDAAMKAENEEIIISTDPVAIIGDSTLTDFTYRVLSQNPAGPYAPWRSSILLSGESFSVKIDTINKEVTGFRMPKLYYSIDYARNKKVARMNGRSKIFTKKKANFYKFPIDSVFFDNDGNVKEIRKYAHYFEASEKYKKGKSIGIDIVLVKKFEYFSDGVLSRYQLENYCDRWDPLKPNEVCQKVIYEISRQGRKFTVEKKNVPANAYADGTYFFEFDDNFDLKRMEFSNGQKDLEKKCIVELNDDKFVKRYLYEKGGRITKTLLINYNDDPNAKHKIETIYCYFEDDNISYYQHNTTTGKKRNRDKLTMKWGPWK